MTTSQQRRSISVQAGSELQCNIRNKTYFTLAQSKSVAGLSILQEERVSEYETLYLWSDIVRSTTESCSTIISKQVLLAHAEVSDLYVSLVIQHHIV